MESYSKQSQMIKVTTRSRTPKCFRSPRSHPTASASSCPAIFCLSNRELELFLFQQQQQQKNPTLNCAFITKKKFKTNFKPSTPVKNIRRFFLYAELPPVS